MTGTFNLSSNTAAVIQQTVQSYVIAPLVAESVVLQQPAIRTFRTSAPIRVPSLSQATGLGFVAEGGTIPVNDVATSEIDLLPSSMEGLKTITVVSRELIRAAVLGIEQVLTDRIVYDIALAADAALINGNTANTPLGLLQNSGILTQTYVATGASAETGVIGSASTDAIGSLGDPNTFLTALGTFAANHLNLATSSWLIHPTDWFGTILQSRDSLGRGLFTPSPTADTPNALFGTRAVISTQIPQGTLALIDWSRVLVALDEMPDVQVLIEAFASQDSVGVKVVTRLDVGLAHPQAVLSLTAAA
jgi:HK97 family phage major capsid protein